MTKQLIIDFINSLPESERVNLPYYFYHVKNGGQ